MSVNSIFILLEKFMKIGFYFAFGIITARELGPRIFGEYSVILSVTVVLTAISALGLNSLLTKEFLSKRKSNVLSSALSIRFLSCVVMALINLSLMKFVFGFSLLIALISSIFILMSLTQIIDLYFESTLKNSVVCKYRLGGYLIGFLIKIVAVFYYKTLVSLLVAQAIELSAIFIFSCIALKVEEKNLPNLCKVDTKYSLRLVKLGFPLFLSSIAVILYMKIDQIFIVNMLGAEQSGFYASAVRLCEGIFLISTIILPSVFPNLVKSYNDNKNEARFNILVRKVVVSLSLIGIVFALFIYFCAAYIITIVYGAEYNNSIDVLKIYALSIPVVFLGDIFSRWLIITENLYLSLQRHLLGLVVNLILNTFLIPIYGIKGAAVATVCSYITSIIVFSLVSYKGRKFYSFLR